MRVKGYPYWKIAEELGVSIATANTYVTYCLKELVKHTETRTEDLRQLELARLDAMLVPHLAKACKGDTWSTDRVLQIMERRTKYLGLDKPIQHILGGDPDNPISIEHRKAEDAELLESFRRMAAGAKPSAALPKPDPADREIIDVEPEQEEVKLYPQIPKIPQLL